MAVFKNYVDSTSLHQTVRAVDVRDRRLLAGVSETKLSSQLPGNAIISTRRHGKNLFAILESGDGLAFHFGMTGSLSYYREGNSEPKYAQLILTLTTTFI